MKESLPLSRSAEYISRATTLPQLRDVPSHRLPPPYLPLVVIGPASQKIPAVPFEPSARILRVDPSLRLPNRERLARMHAKVIQLLVPFPIGREFRPREPIPRELSRLIAEVQPAEYPELEHLFRREIRLKSRIKFLLPHSSFHHTKYPCIWHRLGSIRHPPTKTDEKKCPCNRPRYSRMGNV